MERIVEIPLVNEIRMLPSQPVPPNAAHYQHYDYWWFNERLKAWEGTNTHYFQKKEHTDILTLVAHANNDNEGATLQIIDCHKQVVHTFPGSGTTVSGHEVTSHLTEIGYPSTTYNFSQNLILADLEDGIYYLVLRTTFNDPDDPNADAGGMVTEISISEPISIRESHPGTIQLKYSHSKNKDDVFYVLHGIVFHLRVEGHIHALKPNGDSFVYIEEDVDITDLDSTPYETEVFSVRNVPEWMLIKINRAQTCDAVLYGDKEHYIKYKRVKDSEWETQQSANQVKIGASIPIIRAKNYNSIQFISQTALVVWEVLNNGDGLDGTRFPYFVKSARLNRSSGGPVHLMVGINGATGIGYSTYCKEVRNAADEQLLLDHANNTTKYQYNQSGAGNYSLITTSGGGVKLVYQPAPDETNYTGSTSVVLTQHWENNFNNSWLTGHWFDIKGSQIGYAFVNQAGVHKSLAYGNGNPNIVYTVGSNGIFLDGNTSRVYHHEQSGGGTDTITEFKNVTGTVPNLVSIDKRLPEALITFMSRYSTAMTEFNAAVLAPCMANIFLLDLYLNSALASVTANTWSITFGGQQLQDLKIIDMSRCDFTPASVDDILNEIYNGGGGAQTIVQNMGDLYIDLQTPAAPPTAASAAAITYLTGTKLWSVQTD